MPGSADKVCPSCADPLIVGNAVFAGAAISAVTSPVSADVADAAPAVFVAVTTTTIVEPTSDPSNVYDELVAPPMAEHVPELQLPHW